MDLTITITDTNGDILRTISIFEEGSDEEEANYIIENIKTDYSTFLEV